MFYDNFIMYCNRIGKSPSFAAVEMGFHRSEVTRWSKGVMPRRANLLRIATYFGCTIDDLLIEKTAAVSGDGNEALASKITSFLLSLPPDRLRGILLALEAPEDILDELDHQARKE